MTRFPTTRRFIKASAVAVPLLFYSAFLLVAAKHLGWSLLPLMVAIVLGLAFPYRPKERFPAPAATDDTDKGWLRSARLTAQYLIYWWVISQPEVMAFVTRVLDDGGLWDWHWLATSFVLVLCSIVGGLRKAAAVSDRAIYDYFTWDESGVTAKPPAS
jgi:hypothetical protein